MGSHINSEITYGSPSMQSVESSILTGADPHGVLIDNKPLASNVQGAGAGGFANSRKLPFLI